MADMIVHVTKEELKALIESAVEDKLRELLSDPDELLEFRKTVRDQLIEQQSAVALGERGEAFEDVVRGLGLD